ncbi:hypothetical protein HMPREF3092_09165 [Brevibacterium sp. HMSC24B04]|nr:hypothetical protein HMPREF3092_09165 [Brevibacterium sp. HMSC24B04]
MVQMLAENVLEQPLELSRTAPRKAESVPGAQSKNLQLPDPCRPYAPIRRTFNGSNLCASSPRVNLGA